MAMPKGRTGNPNGRPRIGDTAAEAIRKAVKTKDWEHAARSLLEILFIEVEDDHGVKQIVPNPTTNGRDRAAAFNALADRAYGKAIQKQIIQEDKEPPINDDELENLRDEILYGDLL